jgi:hypothetical protein
MPYIGYRCKWGSRFQSAPGREAGRCRLGAQGGGMNLGVSIRARPGGRAMQGDGVGLLDVLAVSIRARPGGRAMPGTVVQRWTRTPRFQSAPGREAGRCLERYFEGGQADVIQVSIRARPGGRAMRQSARAHLRALIVSIRARPGGRAMRSSFRPTQGHSRFNPRPAGRPGDAQCWPGVPMWLHPRRFNPRPAGRPGDARLPHSTTIAARRFQSAPGREAGRCLSQGVDVATHGSRLTGFNPRPAGRPGDAGPDAGPSPVTRSVFQSAPGREAGRCQGYMTTAPGPGLVSFNPRPAGRPGDA